MLGSGPVAFFCWWESLLCGDWGFDLNSRGGATWSYAGWGFGGAKASEKDGIKLFASDRRNPCGTRVLSDMRKCAVRLLVKLLQGQNDFGSGRVCGGWGRVGGGRGGSDGWGWN